jgi:ADP-ribose pyrophosphatase
MPEEPSQAPIHVLAQGKYLRLVVQGTWEYTERIGVSGIVGIIPVTDAKELVMVEQFRMPTGKRVVELPAGLAGDIEGQRDEAMESAAARELEEETGYRAGRLQRLMEGPNAAGSSNSQMTFFLADQLVKVGEGGGDEHEDITVHVVPITGIWPWLQAKQAAGLALDPKIFAGLWFAEHLL